ncbi:hypothetical protein BHE74_00043182 [Ensete ventricosum]|nr:hypothetical protein BHE74_00043182 [Ensete ventricosum]
MYCCYFHPNHYAHLLLPSTVIAYAVAAPSSIAVELSSPSSCCPCRLCHRCPSLAIASSSATLCPLHPPRPLLHLLTVAALFLPLLSVALS